MPAYSCKEGEELTLGEDGATTLVMEVFHYILFLVYFLNYFNLLSFNLLNLSCHLQALQQIYLADHIRWMADLLHADAIQQLEVALLGSPGLEVIDLLSGGLVQAKAVTITTSAQPHPHNLNLHSYCTSSSLSSSGGSI